MFNYKLLKSNIHISRVKDATVEWGMPNDLIEFSKKIYEYAYGDAQTKTLIFPGKLLESHNIKGIFVILCYILASFLLVIGFSLHLTHLLLVLLLVFYILYSYKKAGLWGIILQFISDINVTAGFISGIIQV